MLLPIFSLPSKYGIGTFGVEAYKFIDFLVECKQKYWQVLPLGQTGYGDSPYQTFGFYSGNLYFIDLDMLVEEGLLDKKYLKQTDFNIDYKMLYDTRINILKKAYERFSKDDIKLDFIDNNDIDEYCVYLALKEIDALNKELDINKFKKENFDLINFYKFTQLKFYEQWFKLKDYANKLNIKIIGDMPLYASLDSSDVFFNKKNFLLNEFNEPIKVAGCPPDYFSEEGQYWGNPLYDWDSIKENKFNLFKDRINYNIKMFDLVRIDHFRGLCSYYAINYNGSPKDGSWYKAYPNELFDELSYCLDKIIIEDLGTITKDVDNIKMKYKLPSMKVAVFGVDNKSEHLPKNYKYNTIAYTTTHDNLPIKAWVNTLDKNEIRFITNYLNCDIKLINDKLIEQVYKSKAKLIIIQMQDILHESFCTNIPNTLNNWKYRLNSTLLTNEVKQKLINLVDKYNR